MLPAHFWSEQTRMSLIETGITFDAIREVSPRNYFSPTCWRASSPPVHVSSLWRGRARKSLPQMKEGDALGCTQIGPRGPQAVGLSFDLQGWLVEVKQQIACRRRLTRQATGDSR
jgi:hypothetical protein